MDINNLHDLINAVEEAAVDSMSEVWWRGQTEDWPLLSGVHRPDLCSPGKQVQCERDLTIRFLHGARTRHSHWPEGDYSTQLAMMQHYRLPTRLLDWTESPLIALFFSIQNSDDKPGVLWALNPSKLNELEFETDKLLSPYREDVKILFEAPFGVSNKDSEKVAAVVIRHVDVRMTVQLSTFSIHGSRMPLNEYKGNDQFLFKFNIPSGSKQDLRLGLSGLGIRKSNIFPDLDHLADELKEMKIMDHLVGL